MEAKKQLKKWRDGGPARNKKGEELSLSGKGGTANKNKKLTRNSCVHIGTGTTDGMGKRGWAII